MFHSPLEAVMVPLAVTLLGVGIVFAASRLRFGGTLELVLRTAMLTTGWMMILAGLLIGMIAMSHGFAILLWLITLVVVLAAVVRYFASEQQSLLWVLTVAAERGVSLESAARAFGEERSDRIGRQAMLLADYLAAGVPLSLSLKRSGTDFPNAVLLAADIGEETNSLGTALRQATAHVGESEATLRTMIERLFYFAFLIFVCGGAATFVLFKLAPVFYKVLGEFELDVPAATEWFTGAFNSGTSWMIVPLTLLWLVAVIICSLWYVGLAPRNLPLINRLWWSADRATVLRWLAMAIRQGRPLADVLRSLAVRYPQPHVRARLEAASSRIDRGAEWSDSLRHAGLIRRAESSLFKSAVRVGNLPWALEEMAESGIRRSVYRLRAWLTLAFPVVLLCIAVFVLTICLSVLMPLVQLIQGLA